MRELLTSANRDLLHQVRLLQDLIGRTQVPGELTPYVAQVVQLCDDLRQRAQQNLRVLDHNLPEMHINVLQATQTLTQFLALIDTRLALPIVRSKPDDRLVLLVLRWLHDSHERTQTVPFGFSDADFSVYPETQWFPPVYFLPTSRQRTLLYLPLFFHEFGHVLYACHRPEMDDLVMELQRAVNDHLAPRTVRGRASEQTDREFRKDLIATWFSWAQEFYCDAVGLTIGGPAFLEAFSHLFRARSAESYYLPREKQIGSAHPVAWLRTRMLADRAAELGLADLAGDLAESWQRVAATLGVREDYEGTWSDELFAPLRQSLDDMIEESQPTQCVTGDTTAPERGDRETPPQLCNRAWQRFEGDPASYPQWEQEEIQAFLAER